MTDWSETQKVLDMAQETDDPEAFIAALGEFEVERLKAEGVLVVFEDEGEVEQ